MSDDTLLALLHDVFVAACDCYSRDFIPSVRHIYETALDAVRGVIEHDVLKM